MERLIPSLLVITININVLSVPLNEGWSDCILKGKLSTCDVGKTIRTRKKRKVDDKELVPVAGTI